MPAGELDVQSDGSVYDMVVRGDEGRATLHVEYEAGAGTAREGSATRHHPDDAGFKALGQFLGTGDRPVGLGVAVAVAVGVAVGGTVARGVGVAVAGGVGVAVGSRVAVAAGSGVAVAAGIGKGV